MRTITTVVFSAAMAASALAVSFASPLDPAAWPGWRGPGGRGVSDDGRVPIAWGVANNVLWKTPIDGRGYSSPVVWGTHVFLTTAFEGDVEPGAAPVAHTLGGQSFVHPDAVGGDRRQRLVVMAFNAETGAKRWEQTAHDGPVFDARHRAGSYANTTPATDGERVYAWFGSEGMYAYDFDGALAWKADVGDIAAFGMGTGSSPVLHGDLIILQCDYDNGERSFIVALDRRTGKEVWWTTRDVQAGWSTPIIAKAAGGREELITSGNEWVIAYDPATGRELWRAKGTGAWTVASPIAAHGIVVASASHVVRRAVAIRMGGSGDVSDTPQVLWERTRGTAYTPSAIAYGDYAYMLTDSGILTCLDIRTGEVMYEGGRPSASSRVWSSLVAFRDRLFLSTEDGETYVVPAGPKFSIERVNTLDAPIYASIAPAGGRLYIRTTSHLYAFAESATQVPAADPAPLAAGPHAAGFRVDTVAHAHGPLELHTWYPATACEARMTLGDYVDTERGGGDPAQETIRHTRMRACRDAAPLPGRHAVLLGRQAGGTWPLQGEYLASHGYLVVMVASRGARITGTPEERARLIAAQYERMADEMEAALTHVTVRDGDSARVGVLGAGIAPMLFAMRSPRVRAVSMQDSGLFEGGFTADVLRHAPSWRPSQQRAPFLYLVTAGGATEPSRLAEFDAMPATVRLRVALPLPGPASHDDLSTSGYLLRRHAGSDDLRQRTFGAVLDGQRTFFDAFVTGDDAARRTVESGALVRALEGAVVY